MSSQNLHILLTWSSYLGNMEQLLRGAENLPRCNRSTHAVERRIECTPAERVLIKWERELTFPKPIAGRSSAAGTRSFVHRTNKCFYG